MMCGQNILSWMTFVPLIGAGLIALSGKNNDRAVKLIALASSLVSLMLALKVWHRFDPGAGFNFSERWMWISSLNIEYRLGVDGLSSSSCSCCSKPACSACSRR
jgi:NADH-quinone oxidoreductase subunit M